MNKHTRTKGEKIMSARNWTAADAAKVIREGKDVEAIKEISKRFPLFTLLIAKNDLEGLMAIMPEHVTARKLEISAQNGATECTDEEAEDEQVEEKKPAKGAKKSAKPAKKEEVEDDDDEDDEESDGDDLQSMSVKELQALCAKKGIKVAKYGKSKQYYIDALNEADGEESEAEVDEDDDEEENEYAGKSAKELFKLCKSRGIKVAPNKKADVYIKALTEADNESVDEEDDDWGDEEEEKPTKKASKKSTAKPSKTKAKAKAEEEDEEEEDDDDWDI